MWYLLAIPVVVLLVAYIEIRCTSIEKGANIYYIVSPQRVPLASKLPLILAVIKGTLLRPKVIQEMKYNFLEAERVVTQIEFPLTPEELVTFPRIGKLMLSLFFNIKIHNINYMSVVAQRDYYALESFRRFSQKPEDNTINLEATLQLYMRLLSTKKEEKSEDIQSDTDAEAESDGSEKTTEDERLSILILGEPSNAVFLWVIEYLRRDKRISSITIPDRSLFALCHKLDSIKIQYSIGFLKIASLPINKQLLSEYLIVVLTDNKYTIDDDCRNVVSLKSGVHGCEELIFATKSENDIGLGKGLIGLDLLVKIVQTTYNIVSGEQLVHNMDELGLKLYGFNNNGVIHRYEELQENFG